jgi:hypothetical protein
MVARVHGVVRQTRTPFNLVKVPSGQRHEGGFWPERLRCLYRIDHFDGLAKAPPRNRCV